MADECIHERFDMQPLTGAERFVTPDGTRTEETVQDYWQWAYSELIQSMQRGALAEYIVRMSLERAGFFSEKKVRLNLELQDLEGPMIKDENGNEVSCRIEVKSAGNINSWEPSSARFAPVFRVAKSQIIDNEKGYVNKEVGWYKRQSDLYVFCVFEDSDDAEAKVVSANIMLELKYWRFYLVETERVTNELGDAKTISIGRMRDLYGKDRAPLTFETLGSAIIEKCKTMKVNGEVATRA